MKSKNTWHLGLATLALVLATVALASCGGSGPEEMTFNLEIEDRSLDLDPAVIKVGQGDTVTLSIKGDEHGSVHLHGYDIEQNVGPGETASMFFTADATGKFVMTFHAEEEHEDSGHGELFDSPPLEGSESFSFEFGEHMDAPTVQYHNHMHHEMTGTITVSEAMDTESVVEIDIQEDGSFHPADVTVGHDTKLVWTNVGSGMQRVTSGMSPLLMTEEAEHEEEVTLGSLEVHPR